MKAKRYQKAKLAHLVQGHPPGSLWPTSSLLDSSILKAALCTHSTPRSPTSKPHYSAGKYRIQAAAMWPLLLSSSRKILTNSAAHSCSVINHLREISPVSDESVHLPCTVSCSVHEKALLSCLEQARCVLLCKRKTCLWSPFDRYAEGNNISACLKSFKGK